MRDDNYRVMTLNYLIDNLLSGNDPVITWFLGIDNTLWGMFSGSLPELSSGVRRSR